jgi:hypothetical protein
VVSAASIPATAVSAASAAEIPEEAAPPAIGNFLWTSYSPNSSRNSSALSATLWFPCCSNGSAAAGDHHADFSDLNVLCVLKVLGTRELAAVEDVFRWWREQGSPSPLLLTETELSAASDCFAIEFHDIQRQHHILHGPDLVSALVLDDSFYRAQVEHELRAKLLRLRQKAAGMMSNPDLLRRMLLDSVSTFCVLFRHALFLKGFNAPFLKRDVIQLAREVFSFDPGPSKNSSSPRRPSQAPRNRPGSTSVLLPARNLSSH